MQLLKVTVVVILTLMLSASAASEVFPSVGELQDQLHVFPGATFPQVVEFRGKIYQVYYVGAENKAEGKYLITIQLKH